MLKKFIAAFLLLTIAIVSAAWSGDTKLFVAVDGQDAAPGTKNQPLATLYRALEMSRTLFLEKKSDITIYMRAGYYPLNRTLEWGAKELSSSTGKVTICAYNKESVHVTGGRMIEGFTTVKDEAILQQLSVEARVQVVQADLKALGITDCGTLTPRGFGRFIQPSSLELFFKDRPMTLARWPNNGWATISDTLAGQTHQAFIFKDEQLKRWAGASDAWVHGYWTWDWADSYEKIESIDLDQQRIVTKMPGGIYGYTPGKRFYALNILQELDSPGEYYLDGKTGLLYFWPPESLNAGQVQVSLLSEPLIHLKNAKGFTLQGLTLECGRAAGIVIEGGSHNLIEGCTIRNMGTVGICIGEWNPNIGGVIYDNTLYNGNAGTENGVQSCDVYQCGEGGIILTGGDRTTLSPGNNYVDNCHLYDVCRWVNTYRAAIFMWGVGNRANHNLIHDLPHTAIFIWGNDHLLEFNEMYNVCLQTGDAGAVYLGRDWTQRGSVIRYNYFHDLHGVDVRQGFVDVMAIYLDDWASGTTIHGNVFKRAGRSIMIGGGRDNVVDNNLVIDGTPALHVDARGIGWAKNYFDGRDKTLFKRLEAVSYQQSPYATRYPALKAILEDQPALPKGNQIIHNVIYGGAYREFFDGVDEKLVLFKDNVFSDQKNEIQIEKKQLQIPAHIVRQAGFNKIPFAEIGLYEDRFRP
jgi:hypothetical protein